MASQLLNCVVEVMHLRLDTLRHQACELCVVSQAKISQSIHMANCTIPDAKDLQHFATSDNQRCMSANCPNRVEDQSHEELQDCHDGQNLASKGFNVCCWVLEVWSRKNDLLSFVCVFGSCTFCWNSSRCASDIPASTRAMQKLLM